nr:putative reverse transcriptase domain-containing protein [Tanacetum cinerariifolium]
MSVTIQSSVKDNILATLIDTSKVENAPAEMLRKANVVTDALSRKERVKPRRIQGMAMIIQYGSEMDDLPCGLEDAAKSIRDAIRFEFCLASLNIEESSLTRLELVQEMTDKLVLVKEKPKAARDRQKSYVDYRCKPLEFEGKLAPRYVELFEILDRIGSLACGLRLPKELSSVHDIFHVSKLKKVLAEANLHVPLDEIEVDKTLHFVEETNKAVTVCHENVVRILLEGDEILRVQGERTQRVAKTLLNTKSSVKDNILDTLIDTSKVENAPAEMLRKANVVTDALSRKERVKPRRIRAMAMIIQHGVRGMTLVAQSEAFKQENKVKWMRPMHQDGQSERIIQTLEDIMRAGAIDFSGSYHLSIWCAPFEALYTRKCRSHVLWADIEESSLTGLVLVQEMTDKLVLVKEKPKAARDRQKSYVDYRCKPLEFEEEVILLAVELTKFQNKIPLTRGYCDTYDLNSYAYIDSLLLTLLSCDDIHEVTPRVFALAGCDSRHHLPPHSMHATAVLLLQPPQ